MVFSIMKSFKADKINANADRINTKAFEKEKQSKKEKDEKQYEIRQAIEKLMNRKKAILTTSIHDFLATYEKIIKINFIESDGIKELSNDVKLSILQKELITMSDEFGVAMTNKQEAIAFLLGGTLTPCLGSVLLGTVGGVITVGLAGAANVEYKEAQLNENMANMRRKSANIVASQNKTITVALEAIGERANRLSDVLTKLNILLRKSLKNVESIIDKNGYNRANYSKYEKECLMVCINTAKVIKDILDMPLVDEQGEISKQSVKAIAVAEEHCKNVSQIISG